MEIWNGCAWVLFRGRNQQKKTKYTHTYMRMDTDGPRIYGEEEDDSRIETALDSETGEYWWVKHIW